MKDNYIYIIKTFGVILLLAFIVSYILESISFNLFTGGFYSLLRNTYFLFMLIYLTFLFIESRTNQSILLIILIPFLQQFYHIILGWEIAPGANSFLRLLPIIAMDVRILILLNNSNFTVSKIERTFLIFWLLFCSIWIIISPNFLNSGLGTTLIFFISIPTMYFFIKSHTQLFNNNIALLFDSFIVGYIILAVGTLALPFVGLQYHNSESFLVTRNIADSNMVMAYLILMFPFVIESVSITNKWLSPIIIILFILNTLLSFSRGSLILAVPLLLYSLFVQKIKLKNIILPFFALFLLFNYIFLIKFDFIYLWSIRFNAVINDIPSFYKESLNLIFFGTAESGREDIRSVALKMFYEKPIIGNGFNSFQFFGGYGEAHSIFYNTLAENGIVGIIILISAFSLVLKNLFTWAIHEKSGFAKLYLVSYILFIIFNLNVNGAFYSVTTNDLKITFLGTILFLFIAFMPKISLDKLNQTH